MSGWRPASGRSRPRLRDGSGQVIAARNVNRHAAETAAEQLVEAHLPLLPQTAGDISAYFARLSAVSQC